MGIDLAAPYAINLQGDTQVLKYTFPHLVTLAPTYVLHT